MTLNKEKLFDVILLAYMYKCDPLKRAVSKFLDKSSYSGYFTEIITSGKWIDFSSENKELAGEIITDIFEKMKIRF
jgi:hypothetical protein